MTFKLIDNTSEVKKQMNSASERGMKKALLIIESAVKSETPVLTGGLRDSINHTLKSIGATVEGKVGTPLKYGIYVEFGTGEHAENGAGRQGGWMYQDPSGKWYFTRGQKAQKFMRKGFRQNKDKVQDVLGKEYSATFRGG
ncbi:HK97-gp10 family putative phage morphogenesis protein [Vagococcus sp.]|uniref:HK97-gp10 family putative phage morphogenesis protein n=1 Tax=Vagococcus sp. TaxID=1933889 RepID=UPI003F989C72